VAEIALELQRNLGAEVAYHRVDTLPGSTQCCVIYEFWDEGVGLPAGAAALGVLSMMEASTAAAAGEVPGRRMT
jgi:hypothetical protein